MVGVTAEKSMGKVVLVVESKLVSVQGVDNGILTFA